MLRSLQKVYDAKRIRGCTIIDTPPFFEFAGRERLADAVGLDKGQEGPSPAQGEGDATIFWGDDQGPVVMVWDGMLPGEQGRRGLRRLLTARRTGFVWLDRSRCGSERIGREEEGTSSGRAEMGAYAAILRRTPDHEDLLTRTDSEVL